MFHSRASELNRLQICDWCDSSGSPDLVPHAHQFRTDPFSFKFVCKRPTWTLGCHAQALLLIVAIDLDDQTIDGKPQIIPCTLPMGDRILDLLHAADNLQSTTLRRLESPSRSSLHGFAVRRDAQCHHRFSIHIVHHAVQWS